MTIAAIRAGDGASIFEAKFAVLPMATLALNRCAAPILAIIVGPKSIETRNSRGGTPVARRIGLIKKSLVAYIVRAQATARFVELASP